MQLPDALKPPLPQKNSTTSVATGGGGESKQAQTTLSLSPSLLQSSEEVTDHFPVQPLSPSDEWISSPSSTGPPSSLFGPTDPSIHDDEMTTKKWTTSTPHVPTQPPITYPHSLGGAGDRYNLSHLASSFGWQESQTPFIDSQENTELCHIYTKPLEDMVQAATEGNQKQLQEKAAEFAMKAQELSKLAETAASNSRSQEVARVLNKESANITYLTPRIIKKAEEVLNMEEEEEEEEGESLQELGQEWTGHLNKLLEASQAANMPWSKSARRLVTSAKKKRGLKKETSHIGSQTQRMVGVASTTIKAALVEDSIGSTTNLDSAQDPAVQKQIESVQEHMKDIESVTPQFTSTAGQVAKDQPEDEKLYLFSHQWATAASALMKNVDDITFGMSGPADALLLAAKSNDAELLKEQAESIKRLADSMLTVAKDAVEGCDDESLVKSVLDTAQGIQELSSELVEYAHEIASLKGVDEEGHQFAVEKAEILKRDWAAKMHLLTAYIDDLTANVAGPLDRLVSVSLQASRTDGMAKEHLLEQFKEKKEFATGQLDKVNSELDCVMKKTKDSHPLVMKCKKRMMFLVKVLPHAIGAARSLSDDPSSMKLDHFSHLRRQWTAKAHSFHYGIVLIDENESEIDVSLALSLFRDLLQGYVTSPSAQKTSRSRGNIVLLARPLPSLACETRGNNGHNPIPRVPRDTFVPNCVTLSDASRSHNPLTYAVGLINTVTDLAEQHIPTVSPKTTPSAPPPPEDEDSTASGDISKLIHQEPDTSRIIKQKRKEPKPSTPMEKLISMGFANRAVNNQLLKKHGNDVDLVLNELLETNGEGY